MHQRCSDPSRPDFKWYGGRGITICERWNSFENFLTDMGERPEGKTLDRYPDHDGNYEPGNCRWATPTEQANNRRSNREVIYRGERMTLAELARRSGVQFATLRMRIESGWSVEKAAEHPVRPWGR